MVCLPRWLSLCLLCGLMLAPARSCAAGGPDRLELQPGEKIVLIGNTLAERMQYFGHWETLLHSRFPGHKLVVRNLGWSADTITVRLRSKDFVDHGHSLVAHQPDVILACFGFNESFAGPAGVEQFETDLGKFVGKLRRLQYDYETYERGSQKPTIQGLVAKEPVAGLRIVLISPIANQDLAERGILAGKWNNEHLRLYTEAMRRVAAAENVQFVDLFHPTRKLFEQAGRPLTINGVHLNASGDASVAVILDQALFGTPHPVQQPGAAFDSKLGALRAAVLEKSTQFFYDYRAVNGYYIYGGRKNPFGVVNFPAEFAVLRKIVVHADERIWAMAQGRTPPEAPADLGEFAQIQTNIDFPVEITPPEIAQQSFTLPEGYEINLFASEVEFPDLQNPVQFAFDARGRLWVATMPSYPMYLPGTPPNDKLLIFEDADGDGRADKQTVFADGLHLPTGIELGDGGAYLAQQPNLVFLKDIDGDDRADLKEIVLHGFDSADSHHAISAFEWGPGGDLYFQEGTFHHTQVETPYGPQRCANAGVFRYEPRTEKFEVFVSYDFANPWGHVFDRWGQNFVADASGGANHFGTAFSGQIDHPYKHGELKQFLVKQWRPTCGCELVSSRQFPDDTQGDYLLNNCIGFQGVLRYRMKEVDSGFFAEPVEPLLRSSDRNFRPVDLVFAPDGTLYVLDWFNPLVGHMQHSLRDPNRDKSHGRIWRIRHTGRPLVEPAKIAGQPLPALLDLLKVYEDRTRYRARLELRSRKTEEVMAAVDRWIAGLDKNDADYQHHLLEALWVRQHHDVVDEPLLKQLLASPEPRARAAATRVLCYWRDRVQEPLELLRQQVNDAHPRVRLEAIRALSFFDGRDASAALEVAVEALLYDQDDYLKYTLKETMDTLERRSKGK